MKRPIPRFRSATIGTVPGFTLIEILVATTLSLLLLGVVITMFGNVSESITESRAMLEAADRLRLAEERLHLDLIGATAIMNPPGRPDDNRGYFEYIEGPATLGTFISVNSEHRHPADQTVGDFDDILMFTTRSSGRPFVGKFGGTTIQSERGRGGVVHSRPHASSPRAAGRAERRSERS